MLSKALNDIKTAINERRAIFLIGAGVSIYSPTQFPAAIPLANEILHRTCERNAPLLRDIFAGDSPDALLNPFHKIGHRIADSAIIHKKALRLEVILEELFQSFGPEGLECLSFMKNCKPNAYHEFLAACYQRGCSIMTTNFDSGIEDACRNIGIAPTVLSDNKEFINYLLHVRTKNFIVKLHGGLDKPLEALGATLSVLENGITGARQQFLDRLLEDKHLVVIGYSGSDHFDITPYLLNRQFSCITWIQYDDSLASLNVSKFQKSRLSSGTPYKFDAVSVPGLLLGRAENSWWVEGLPVQFIEYLLGKKQAALPVFAKDWWKTQIAAWGGKLNPVLAAFTVGRIAQGIGLARIAQQAYDEAMQGPLFQRLPVAQQANIELQKEYLLSLTGKYKQRETFIRDYRERWSIRKSELKENWNYLSLITEKKLASCMIFDDRLCLSAMYLSRAISGGWLRLKLISGQKDLAIKLKREIAESNTDLLFMSRIYLRRWFFELPGWLLEILYRIQRGGVSPIVHSIFPVSNGGLINRIRAMQYMGATDLKSILSAPRYYLEVENLLGLSNTLRENALEMVKDFKRHRSSGDLLNARKSLRLSLFVSKQIDDLPGVAKAYHHLAWIAFIEGQRKHFNIFAKGAEKHLAVITAQKWKKRRLDQINRWRRKLQ